MSEHMPATLIALLNALTRDLCAVLAGDSLMDRMTRAKDLDALCRAAVGEAAAAPPAPDDLLAAMQGACGGWVQSDAQWSAVAAAAAAHFGAERTPSEPMVWSDADVRECAARMRHARYPHTILADCRTETGDHYSIWVAPASAALAYAAERVGAVGEELARAWKDRDFWLQESADLCRIRDARNAQIAKLRAQIAALTAPVGEPETIDALATRLRNLWWSRPEGDKWRAVATEAVAARRAPMPAVPQALLDMLPSDVFLDWRVTEGIEGDGGCYMNAARVRALRDLLALLRHPAAPAPAG